jgi:hypothetical protein
MNSPLDWNDYRENEFYSYRYTSRFQKGDIIEIRTGVDLEVARFHARKNFPDVLNEYWWMKPSDVPALRELPLKISDIYFYHGGVPVVVFITPTGNVVRKAQIFLKKRDESKASLDQNTIAQIVNLTEFELFNLLESECLLVRLEAFKILKEKFPEAKPDILSLQLMFNLYSLNFEPFSSSIKEAIPILIERFFVTSNAKETEHILDTLISFGIDAVPPIAEVLEYVSPLASPYYSKRLNWVLTQIKTKSPQKSTI